jgi:hypothetical protein
MANSLEIKRQKSKVKKICLEMMVESLTFLAGRSYAPE